MFAPPFPHPQGRAGPSPSPSPSPYDGLGLGPPRPHVRHRSQSWDRSAGLPPRPWEIDEHRGIEDALRPTTPSGASRPTSPMSPRGQDGRRTPATAMNTVSRHPKVKLDVFLDSTLFIAGGAITGRIELTAATAQKLRLGDIAVELHGVEELTSRDHSATQTFLYNRTLFQGQHLPPSNAVQPHAPLQGYWFARKGRTTFPFSFRLPASAPSSVTFAGNAALRYVVKGSVQAWYHDSKATVSTHHDAFVAEQWQDTPDAVFHQPVEDVGEASLLMGGPGSVWLEARVHRALFVAGTKVTVTTQVRNGTKRHVSGIRIDVVRNLTFPAGQAAATHNRRGGPTISEVVHTQQFRGQELEFPPGAQVVVDLPIDLPSELCTVRKTRLFEVFTTLVVVLQTGGFARDLEVRLPIYVAHDASLGASGPAWSAPVGDAAHGHHRFAQSPAAPDTNYPHPSQYDEHRQRPPSHGAMMHIPRSQSAMGHHGAHIAFPASPSISAAPSPAPVPDGPGVLQLPQGQMPFAIYDAGRESGRDPAVQWFPSAAQWGASQFQLPRPSSTVLASADPEQDHAPPLSASGAQGLEGPPAPVQDPSTSHGVQRATRAVSSAGPVNTTTHSVSPQPLGLLHEDGQTGAAMAHLDPQGLATIVEDSESGANTVRSVWALGGDRTGAKRSVSPAEVDLFERLATVGLGGGEDDRSAEGAKYANRTFAPDQGRPSVKDVFVAGSAAEPASPPRQAPAHEIAPTPEAASEPETMQPARAHSEAFDYADAKPADSSASQLNGRSPFGDSHVPTDATVEVKTAGVSMLARVRKEEPARLASVQGQGLTALERRLGVTGEQQSSSSPPVVSPLDQGGPRSTAVGAEAKPAIRTHHEPVGSLRATAMARLRRSESRMAEPSISKAQHEGPESSTPPATEGPVAAATRVATPEHGVALFAEAAGQDKDVEARQLSKDAVRRVDGWLKSPGVGSGGAGSSPSTSSAEATEPVGDEARDSFHPARPFVASYALGGGVLSNASQVTGGSAAAKLTRATSGSVLARRYEQAVENARGQSDPPPPTTTGSRGRGPPHSAVSTVGKPRAHERPPIGAVEKTATSPHPSTSDPPVVDAVSHGSSGSVRPAAVFSRWAHAGTSVAQRAEDGVVESPLTTTGGQSHDARSVRGGRGGRVASAASLWASIANGTDGKLAPGDEATKAGDGSAGSQRPNASMRRTMVNARPQARRSMNGEAPALDFSDAGQVAAAIQAHEREVQRERGAENGGGEGPDEAGATVHAAPKAVRPRGQASRTPAALAIPSIFSGHPRNATRGAGAGAGGGAERGPPGRGDVTGGGPPKLARRAAPPFLNTTVPKVHLTASTEATATTAMPTAPTAAANAARTANLGVTEDVSVNGRGTTRAVGRERLGELRSLFAT